MGVFTNIFKRVDMISFNTSRLKKSFSVIDFFALAHKLLFVEILHAYSSYFLQSSNIYQALK